MTPAAETPAPTSPSSPSTEPAPTSSPPDTEQVSAQFQDEDDADGGDFGFDFLKGEGDPAAAPDEGRAEARTTPATPAAPSAPATPQVPGAVTAPAAPAAAQPPAQAATPAQPAAPSPAPAATPPAVAPAATPATPPAASSATPAQPVPAAQPSGQSDPFAAYQAQRATHLTELETKVFAITPEVAEALQTEPEKVYPRLAAQLYMMAVENSTAALAEMLPVAIERHFASTKLYQDAETEFFGAWPGLADKKAEVAQIGQAYRAVNPKASKEDFIKQVGELAHMTLGVPKPQASPPAPTARPLPPHTPAAAAVPRGAAVTTPNNPFAEMAGRRGEISAVGDEDED